MTELSGTEWIAPSLARFGWVGGLVPPQFEAYAQVGLPGWEAPLQENGIDPKVLGVLCELIAQRHAVTECWMALWEGYGWVRQGHGGPPQITVGVPRGQDCDRAFVDRVKAAAVEPTFPVEVLEGPKLRLPHREYLVFRGPLTSALALGEHHFGWFEAHAPDLLWPEDRAWFIATDTDLRSAYVGGSAGLIADILDEGRLAAVVVQPDDPLSEDGGSRHS